MKSAEHTWFEAFSSNTLRKLRGIKSNVRTKKTAEGWVFWFGLFPVWLDVTLLLVFTISKNFLVCEVPSHSNDEPGLGDGCVDWEGWGQKVAVCRRTAGEESSPSPVLASGDSEVPWGGRRAWFSSAERIREHFNEVWELRRICESLSLLWENCGCVRGSRGGQDRRKFDLSLDSRSRWAAGDH